MKLFFLIFTCLIIQSSFLIAQEVGFKTGIGLINIYPGDEVYYFRNNLNYQINPSFILSYCIVWSLGESFHLSWEPGVIEKSGRVNGLAIGHDLNNNSVYGHEIFKLWNIENSILLKYDVLDLNGLVLTPYIGPGFSLNFSDKQEYFQPETPLIIFYSDYPTATIENPLRNNTGMYMNAGVNLQFRGFQFDLRYIKEFSDLRVNDIGRYKSSLFFMLLGYMTNI